MTKLPHHVRTGSDEPSHLPVEHESRFRVLRRLHWPQRLRRHSNIKIILVLLLCFALIQLRGSKKVIRHVAHLSLLRLISTDLVTETKAIIRKFRAIKHYS